jgi:hypothetical protein
MGGWKDYYGYLFEVGESIYSEPAFMGEVSGEVLPAARAQLRTIVPHTGATFFYTYDFRDDWLHELKVEANVSPDPHLKYPRCVDGARWGPPDHIGGVQEYLRYYNLLTSDIPSDREIGRVILNRNFDPERFKVETINARLRMLDRQSDASWYRARQRAYGA